VTKTPKGGVVAKGTTGANGTIAFSNNPNGTATYAIVLDSLPAVAKSAAAIPRTMEMRNYPNPFSASGTPTGVAFGSPGTTITFALPQPGKATLAIYNTAGQLVRTLISETLAGGAHQITWNATNENGARVSSGVYLCRLEAGGLVSQVKLALTK
jgi:hypothetical protein